MIRFIKMCIAEKLDNGDSLRLPKSSYIDRELEQLRKTTISIDPNSTELSTCAGTIHWLLGPNNADLNPASQSVDPSRIEIAAGIKALEFLSWSAGALNGIGWYSPVIPADSPFHREVNQQFLKHLKNYLLVEKYLEINPEALGPIDWDRPISELLGDPEQLIAFPNKQLTTIITRTFIKHANYPGGNCGISGIIYKISSRAVIAD